MQVTSTEFRRNLFQLVERALNGEHIEVIHKGRTLKLLPGERNSKLSRLKQRNTLVCSPDEIDAHLKKLDEEMRMLADEKWRTRL